MKTTLAIAMMAVLSTNSMASTDSTKIIYGKDNRTDLYEVTNAMYKKLAASTVALVPKEIMNQNSSGGATVKAQSFGDLMSAYGQPLCKTERFIDQPSGGFCSGSLIGPNLILTAGHCIQRMSDCQSTNFVFNYAVNAKGAYPRDMAKDDVYSCKNIIYQVKHDDGEDFAIVETDRAVKGHAPLRLSARADKIARGTELVMIGHPSGLPTKVEDGGKVQSTEGKGFFVANTDSYGGNSGSGVFNRKTGEIEGVLVRGARDFVKKGSCYTSNVVADEIPNPNPEHLGEEITDVSYVARKMPGSRRR